MQRHEDHFWSEIIAYRIGCLIGVKVPPVFVAYNSETGDSAALIEWFTDFEDQYEERFIQGGDIMQRMINDFDRDKGKQHNFEHLANYFKLLQEKSNLTDDWKKYWVGAFLFDALIGNTDRHQDNWGWLISIEKGTIYIRISPLFDNGTSLGYEILPRNFTKYYNSDKLNSYIKKGTHHMKWKLQDEKKTNHIDMLVKFCKQYPSYKSYMLELAYFDLDKLGNMLEELTQFEVPIPFSKERADFVYMLVSKRKSVIIQTLKGLA